MEMDKIMRDIDRVDGKKHFPLVAGSTSRGCGFRVRGRRFTGGCEENLFHPEGGESLEPLPERVVEAEIPRTFKKYLGVHLQCQGLPDHGPSWVVCL